MSRTDTPPDASASRVIAPTLSYCCPGPKPAALWPMRQGWSSTRGLVPRAGESGRLLHRGGMDTQTNRARGSFVPVSMFADLMCYPALRAAIMRESGSMMLQYTIDDSLVLKDFP